MYEYIYIFKYVNRTDISSNFFYTFTKLTTFLCATRVERRLLLTNDN